MPAAAGEGTVAGTYSYRGRLSETTLPEMLSTIHRFRVPGVIQASHRNVTKRIFVREGYVIHASSDDRSDSLGDYLLRSGRLTEMVFEEISRLRRASDQRFGVLLVEREVMSPAEVQAAIRDHVEAIVWSLFYWQQGEVTFSIGEFQEREAVQIQVPLRQVILRGIRRAPDAKPLVGRLGRRETVLEPGFRWEDLVEIGLDRNEYKMLMLVDARRTLYELCSLGPLAPAENAKLLYAFQVLHLVRRRTGAEERSGPVKIRLGASGDARTS
jgi:Domain of unknown function (DUF4388)